MNIRAKRLIRSFGWLGVAFTFLTVLAAVVALNNPASLRNGGDWRLLAMVPTGLAGVVYCLWGYQRPQATGHADLIVPGLLRSAEEFGLILRPFGDDGEIILNVSQVQPGAGILPFRPTLTIEQVIAKSAATCLGLKAYALADQNRTLAPPGPVFLRTSHDNWRGDISAMIGRAYAIFIILPPNQLLRESFTWEIEQITRAGLQARTVILLPPENQDRAGYARAVKQAALLTVAMETATGKTSDANPFLVRQRETRLAADHCHVMTFQRSPRRWTWWRPVDPPGKRRGFRRRKPVIITRTYLSALAEVLQGIKHDLADLPFAARYPLRRTISRPH